MNQVYHNVDQNTYEWFNLRLGRFTASSFKDLFMKHSTIGYEKAIYKTVFERLTGEAPENFSSMYMDRGHELEPLAVDAYQEETFNDVVNGGFFSLGEWVGASPDGLVGENGILEIKSPAYNTMINYLLKNQLPSNYKWQVQGQLYVTGREWCDFMAFHPKLKPLILRINRAEKEIETLKSKLTEAIGIASNIYIKLKENE